MDQPGFSEGDDTAGAGWDFGADFDGHLVFLLDAEGVQDALGFFHVVHMVLGRDNHQVLDGTSFLTVDAQDCLHRQIVGSLPEQGGDHVLQGSLEGEFHGVS